MDEYGVTDKGFVKKRYDDIYSEIQDDIKSGTGIDIAANPKSYINTLVSAFTDRISALYEVAEDVYYSHYPSTADGVNLDYACQFGGVSREEGTSSKYYIVCTGDNGILIPSGTRISTYTKPVIYFVLQEDTPISLETANKATIATAGSPEVNTVYSVKIDGTEYQAEVISTAGNAFEPVLDAETLAVLKEYRDTIADTGVVPQGYSQALATYYAEYDLQLAEEIFKELKTQIENGSGFSADVVEEEGSDGETVVYLKLAVDDVYTNHFIELNSELTAADVSTVMLFKSEEFGEYRLAADTITVIVTNLNGFTSCTNLPVAIYGTDRESDIELRKSYLKKQAYRSSTMLSSITSAILNNCDGVTSAVGFENDSDVTDENGLPPHSIEIVVDGGENFAIAQQILYYKAAGIATYGTETEDAPTEFNYTIPISFSRPVGTDVWLLIEIYENPDEAMPANLEELVRDSVSEWVDDNVTSGENIIIQRVQSDISAAVSGIAYMNIRAAYEETERSDESGGDTQDGDTEGEGVGPEEWTPEDSDYTHRYVEVDMHHKAYFDVEERLTIRIYDETGDKLIATYSAKENSDGVDNP